MDFKATLEARFKDFFSLVSTDKGDWTVKGFIDVYKNIYTISIDTKVVSKIVELMIFPITSACMFVTVLGERGVSTPWRQRTGR